MTKYRMSLIEPPDWATQPDLRIHRTTVADYTAIQRRRAKMLKVVHREIEEYLNTPGLYGEGESFPDRLIMTGTYYIGTEYYSAHEDPYWIQISILCHCLQLPWYAVKREDDYLGLEVWLKWLRNRPAQFEVYRNTDSSAI